MSREIGGRADKDGNEFERLWVVDHALRVLQGKATSLKWEPAGKSGFGMEFEVTFPDGRREVHQCKIEKDIKGRWTAADLNAAGVLTAAQRHLQKPSVSEFVFVSRDPAASALRDLCERSRRTNDDPELFFAEALSAQEHRTVFQQLCKAWGLDDNLASDRAHAFSLLQRIRFETGIWDRSERDRLESTAALLAEGEGREIVHSLGSHLGSNLGKETYADHIREYLRKAGHPPRDLRDDPRVAVGIERLRQSFEDSLGSLLLGGHLLPRAETQALLCLLDDPQGSRIVFLHGPAGIGKSDVELELARTLAERGTPFLPIRLDSQPPRGSLSAYSRDILELPADPAHCLAVLAGNRPGVLLIDQLDALRWTGGHSTEALRVVREILKAALRMETLRIVLACRTFDLENDFKRWEQEYSGRSQRVEVKPLGEDQVRTFVEEQGARYEDFSPPQRVLLQNLYNLFLWWELYRERKEPLHFVNKIGLLSEYRRRLVRKLEEMGQPEAPVLLEELVSHLDEHGRLDAPSALVKSRRGAQEALQSLNVLREPRHGFLTFAHQSLRDFLIAERVAQEALAKGTSPVEWLRRNDQSLFRRDQLRYLLELLRDQDSSLYIVTLEEILTAKDIRFHLQHLVLGTLREPVSPSKDEVRLVERLLDLDGWRPHVLNQVILGSRAWFEKLDDAGLFAKWLASGDDRLIEGSLQACRSVASQVPDRIERLLISYWEAGDEEWRKKIDSALSYEVERFTERMAAWRIARVRDGSRRIDWYDLDDLAGRHPTRALLFLEAHLLNMLDQLESSGKLGFDWRDRTRGVLEKACRSAPDEAWKRLLPIFLRSIRLFRKMHSSPEADLARSLDPGFPRQGLQKINFQVRRLLSEAGAELAQREGLAVLDRIAPLFGLRSISAQRLVLYLFLKGPEGLADFALQWLYLDTRRLGSFQDASCVEPARRLIERFASLCSAEIYEELEARLMTFHSESELGIIQYYHKHLGAAATEYGQDQHLLLSALPRCRMSDPALQRLEAWQRKFGEPSTGRRSGAKRARVGVVRSSIPRERLRLVSDKQWLSIIAGNWSGSWKLTLKEDLIQVSHEQFAKDFGIAARLDPERFIRIALRVSPSAPSGYFLALLNALGDKPPAAEGGAPADWRPAPIERIEEVLRHIEGSLQDRNIAWAVCRLVQTRATESWSDWVLDLLRGYAESQPEPRDFLSLDTESGEDIDIIEESVRGVATETLMTLLFEKRELAETVLPTIEKLVSDPNPVMRVAAQGLCLPVLNIDRNRAVRLFLQSCDYPDARVLAGTYTNRFLRYTWNRHPDDLEPLLARMIESENEKAAEMGAFWATAGKVGEGLYGNLAARCLTGSKAHRKGAAEAMAQLLHRPESKQAALDGLLALLRDSNKAADSQVVDLLREEEILGSPEGPVLAEAYIRSSAFEDDPGDFFYGLKHFSGLLVPYAHILLEALQRLGGDLAPATRDLSTRLSRAVRFLPEILLRLHEQAEGPELRPVRNTCLDAWDSLLRGQVGLNWDVLRRLDA
jgi:NACHT domain-containing protein